MDDSDGGLSYLFEIYSDLWNVIIDKADNTSKDILFNKVLELIEPNSSEYLCDCFESILYSNFGEEFIYYVFIKFFQMFIFR